MNFERWLNYKSTGGLLPYGFAVLVAASTMYGLLRFALNGNANSAAMGMLAVAGAAITIWARISKTCKFIIDTPCSRIGSAAQGYVELQGAADYPGKVVTIGIPAGPSCVWQKYSIRDLQDNTVEVGLSSEPFLLRDDSGACLVNPEGATIISSSKRLVTERGKVISINFIKPGASLYVLGRFTTTGGSNSDFNRNAELSVLLKEWKKDPGYLLSEFDENGNGQLELDEWEFARDRAQTVIEQRYVVESIAPVTHTICKPSDGQPFIISDKDPHTLGWLLRGVGWVSLAIAAFGIIRGLQILA